MKFIKKMKKVMAGILGGVMVMSMMPHAFAGNSDALLLHYSFNTPIENKYVVDVSGNELDGRAYGNTVVKNGYAYFDGMGSYIDMPDNLTVGREALTFAINVRPDMGNANQFTFTLGNSDKEGYLFLNTNNWGNHCRFAITQSNHEAESELCGTGIQSGEWASVVIVANGHDMKMYINGEIADEMISDAIVSSLGGTAQNYIAKSQYANDAYFKGYIDDFRIYSKALTEDEILNLVSEHRVGMQPSIELTADKFEFDFYNLTEDAILPTQYQNTTITWVSDNESVMTNKGVITRGSEDQKVTMTATFIDDMGNHATRDYVFTVIHEYTAEDFVLLDIANIHLVGNLLYLKEDLHLPKVGKYGSKIEWTTSDEKVITAEGEITRAKIGEGSRAATLTATATYNDKVLSRDYEIRVEEEDFAYLFAYFLGDSAWQEKMYYGLSRDGYNFRSINNSNPVLESNVGHKGLRDPFIMKGQNGMYYSIMTDMHASEGWASQSSIVIFESADLIHWDEGTVIDFNEIGWYNRAWAPQAIWDPEFYDEQTGEYGAYMIYLALSSGGPTQMYKVYTKDMKTLITKPEILYKRADNLSDIDSDIIYKDGLYYMYVKDESGGGIYVVTSEHAGGPYSERINELPHDVAIEGSAIYKLINEDKYLITYDAYMSGFSYLTETEDLVNFKVLNRNDYSFDFRARHGYVITISHDEVKALQAAYGKSIAERIEEKKNPVLYYSFDDEKDKSGNFFDAQLMGSATIAQGISGGWGLELDGSSESYVTVPSEVLSELEDYTISVWIKPDKTDNTQRVFDFGTGTDKYMFLTPYYGQGVLRGAITIGSYQNEKGVSVEKSIEPDRWTHMVMSQDGDMMKIYVDGILVGAGDNIRLTPYELQYTLPNCYIGKSQWSADVNFDGTIDEFKIYNRALSDDEIMELYLKEMTLACDVEETEGQYEITLERDGLENEDFTAVVVQYDSEGIVVSAKIEKVSFAEADTISFGVDKVGEACRCMFFENMSSLRPLK